MSDPVIDFCELWKRFLAGDLASAPKLQGFWDTYPVLQRDSELAAELLDYDLQFHQDCGWKVSEKRYAKFLEVLAPADRNAFLARLRDPGPTHDYRPAPEASTRLKDGAVLGDGRYQIERHLSSGGQAHLWLAKAPDGAKFVLKVPRRPGDDKALEFEIGYLLDLEGNPGVIRAHQREQDSNVGGFLVFPYYDKGALPNRKFTGTAKELVDLLLPVIDGVGYLHRHGRVHRDLKPENFLVNQHGRWFLADFGLVFEPKSATLWEAKGVGTPGYCAPEQARTLTFSSEPVGPPADVFSLGVILYRLLTGRFPWSSIEPSLILPDLTPQTFKTEDDVPGDLQRIVHRCLAPRPAERYHSATELAAALRKAFRISLPPQRRIRDLYTHRHFVGRHYVLKAVKSFLQTKNHGVIAIQAEAGRGKTALAYYLARNIGQEPIVFAYRRNEEGAESPRDFLQYVAEQLHLPTPAELTVAEFLKLLEQAAGRLPPEQRLTIIVDGLDEATVMGASDSSPAITAWSVLPPKLPPGVFFILNSRPRPIQGQFSEVPFKLLDLRTEFAEAQRTDCDAFASEQLKLTQLGTAVVRRAVELSSENFLLLETLCKALRVTAQRDVRDVPTLLERVTAHATPESRLYLLFEEDQNRFEEQLSSEHLKRCSRQLMKLMAFASSPFPLDIVSQLHGPHDTEWNILEQAGLEDHLQRNAEEIRTMHDAFRVFLQKRLKADAISTHRQLSDFCLQWRTLNDAKRTYALRNLPMHLAEAGDFECLHETLTALEFLETKNEAGYVYDLARDYDLAAKLPPQPKYDIPRRRLQLLGEALRRDIHFIHHHREDYPQALFQCLWNLCWWYDTPEAVKHYQSGSPPGHDAGASLFQLLDKWHEAKQKANPGFFWVRSLRPPQVHLGSAQKVVLEGHDEAVELITVSSDGTRIASWSRGSIRIWNILTGDCQLILHWTEGLEGLAFSTDGARIIARTSDNTVQIWNSRTGNILRTLRPRKRAIRAVVVSADGLQIAGACARHVVRIWDARTGTRLQAFKGHNGQVTRIAYSFTYRWIASGSNDKTVRIWDLQTGSLVRTLNGHRRRVTSVAFSPNDTWIASGSNDKTVRIWDSHTGALLRTLKGHKTVVTNVYFSPNGRTILSISSDSVRLWDAMTGLLVKKFWSRNHFAFSHDGTTLVETEGVDVRLWDSQSGTWLRTFCGHEGYVNCAVLSPDGNWLISGSSDNTVRIWDAAKDFNVHRLSSKTSAWTKIASTTGSHIATVDSSNDVAVWDTLTGVLSFMLSGHTRSVNAVRFSPNNENIVTASVDRTLRIWETHKGIEQRKLCGHRDSVSCVDFSADGKLLLSGSNDKTIRIWNAQSGAWLRTLRGHEGAVSCIASAPDANWIASGSDDNTVRIWDVSTGMLLHTLRGHQSTIKHIGFSPNAKRLFSCSDLEVHIWNAQTGELLSSLFEYSTNSPVVNSVAFAPDSVQIVTVSEDRVSRIWDADSGKCLELIKGYGDARAIAKGGRCFPYRLLAYEDQSGVVLSTDGRSVAWSPEQLGLISTHASGRIWIGLRSNRSNHSVLCLEIFGALHNYFTLVRLEGAFEALPVAAHCRDPFQDPHDFVAGQSLPNLDRQVLTTRAID